jgi:hypothetical protein
VRLIIIAVIYQRNENKRINKYKDSTYTDFNAIDARDQAGLECMYLQITRQSSGDWI